MYRFKSQNTTSSKPHLCCPASAELTQDEAYDIFKKCVLEIQKRLIVNLSNFKVAVVDKNGIRFLDDITNKTLIGYMP